MSNEQYLAEFNKALAEKIVALYAKHFPYPDPTLEAEIVYEDLLDAETLEVQNVPFDKLLEADLTE
jgi:hypothetical protein